MKQSKLLLSMRGLKMINSFGIFLLTFILFPILQVTSQESRTITGAILSKQSNMPIPGANVLVKGTSVGTVTDFDGAFTITASANDVLVFTYVGFEPQEIVVGEQSSITVSLVEALSALETVVVVGYGTQKKSDLTGSIAVIEADEAQKVSNSDISQLLQGRSAGVNVTSDGEPGAAPNIRIRGVATFGDNQPLYIVDGVPVGTSVRDFSPNDIASIQILKDASAGAIYGSRAANGVVIITTKKGRKNAPLKIQYSGYYGTDEVAQKIPVLGRVDYQTIVNEKRINAGLPLILGNDPSSDLFVNDIDTDWQDVGLKNGTRQNHNFNFSGGGENITYNASVDYLKNT